MRYRCILADCPWRYRYWSEKGEAQGCAAQQYDVQTDDWILNLPVAEIAAPDATLLLWGTNPHIPLACRVVEAWGFRYVTMITWIKMDRAAAPRLGIGHHARGATEHILIGQRGSGHAPPPVPPADDRVLLPYRAALRETGLPVRPRRELPRPLRGVVSQAEGRYVRSSAGMAVPWKRSRRVGHGGGAEAARCGAGTAGGRGGGVSARGAWGEAMATRLLIGDCRAMLATLPAGSVHVCVTSPPYFHARDYQCEPVLWGGDPNCSHHWSDELPGHRARWGDLSTLSEKQASNGGSEQMVAALEAKAGRVCDQCGGWLGQLGLEPLHDCLAWARGAPACALCFVCHMRTVCAAVHRVLRPEGLLFLNLDDSMSGSGKGRNRDGTPNKGVGDKQRTNRGTIAGTLLGATLGASPRGFAPGGLPPQNLCGIPWRTALALQVDGWHLRSAVQWRKPAAMCESMEGWQWEQHRLNSEKGDRARNQYQNGSHGGRGQGPGLASRAQREAYFAAGEGAPKWIDCPGCARCAPDGLVLSRGSGRPTETYETLFVLAKSLPHYWDSWAVRQSPPDYYRQGGTAPTTAGGSTTNGVGSSTLHAMNPQGGNLRNFWSFPEEDEEWSNVWTVGTEPLLAEHYAAYPTALPDRCIRLGTSGRGVCPACGAPWARIIRRTEPDRARQKACGGDAAGGYAGQSQKDYAAGGAQSASDVKRRALEGMKIVETLGWKPTCRCPAAEPVPATVIDPFGGSGRTAKAAERLGRNCILIELREEHGEIARRQIAKDQGLFAEVEG